MTIHPKIVEQLTKERYSAREAQELAHIISFGPIVFQTARLMIKYGIFEMLHQHPEGLTQREIEAQTGLSAYACKCLLEASLTTGTVFLQVESQKSKVESSNSDDDRYVLSKVGWFLLNDPLIRVDIDFNHDVNYEGWFVLDKALEEGRPAGLEHFGSWPTIYEGLSQLPEQVQKSWFGFDHYYSDHSFDEALALIFKDGKKHVLDVGGNTGRFAMRCVGYSPEAEVTICDLPQQIGLMREATKGKEGAERIHGVGMNLLDETSAFPTTEHYDVIWMSQFLDCFSEEQIVSILSRAAKIMDKDNRLLIMETLWDRQKYLPAAFALTQISLYFTALANGNSKMYNTDDMLRLIHEAGLEVEAMHDDLGMGGHTIIVCKR